MAEVKAPLFSLTARGAIDRSAIFQAHAGRNFVKAWAQPTQPRTIAQRAARLPIAAADYIWREILTDDGRQSWNKLARSKRTTPRQAYLSSACRAWANQAFAPVTPTTPPVSPAAAPNWTFFDDVPATLTVRYLPVTSDDLGIFWYTKLYPQGSPGRTNQYAVSWCPCAITATTDVTIHGLPAGTYDCDTFAVAIDGRIAQYLENYPCVIT